MEKEGTKLGDLTNIVETLGDSENEEGVMKLYEVIYGSEASSIDEAIEKLKEFSGEENEAFSDRLNKLTGEKLKLIARVCCVTAGKKKEDSVTNIVDFLNEPKEGKKPRKRTKKDDEKPKKKKSDEEEEEEEDKPKKKARKTKKETDPEAPKRPTTSFIFFSNAKRPEVKAELEKENPGEKITVGQVAKRLGELWKAASDEDKQPYLDQAKEAKSKYEEEMKEYEESGKKAKWEEEHKDDDEKPKKKAAPKKAAAPKKPAKKSKEEEEEEEEPEEKKKPTKAELSKKIKDMLAKQGTDGGLSLKNIRKDLEQHFHCDLTDQKDIIKEIVTNLTNQ